MKLWRVGFWLAMLVLTSCIKIGSPPTTKTKKVEKAHQQKQLRSTKTFSRANFEGDLNVILKPLNRGSKIELQGDSRDIPYVATEIKNGELVVSVPNHYPQHGPVTAIVSTSRLNYLAYQGDGDITAKRFNAPEIDLKLYINGNVDFSGKLGLRDLSVTGRNQIKLMGVNSKHLNVSMNGDVDIKIQGLANLERIKYKGDGRLALYWVESPDLEVLGYGRAKVHLAGRAHYLHAVTHDKSELDARYLRIDKAYVKARDNSLIRLVPIRELNALASEHGHIFYYQSPKFKADYMAQNGAILNFVRYK